MIVEKFITASFRKPVVAIVLALAGSVLGGIWMLDLPRDVFPDLSAPVFNVIVQNPAMSADELEMRVAIPMENALSGVPHGRRGRATSTLGVVQVTVEFEPDADYARSRQYVAERLGQVELPPGTDAPLLSGVTIDAVIQWIGREVDKSSRTIEIRLDVANPDGVLRPGMSATVSVPLGEAGDAQVVVVPAAAVQRVGASWAVFIPHGDTQFEARAIGRGRDLSGDVEVLTGLRAGERVVVEGAFLLKAESDKQRGGGDHDD